MWANLLRTMVAAAVGLTSTVVMAAEWPTKPLRWIVPYVPGGGTDTIARAVGQALSEELGQQVIIENRPGAATIVGAEALARAEPDGYTMMSAGLATLVNNPALYANLPYDPVKDFAPVSLIGTFSIILVVNPSTGIKNFDDWRQKIKASPDKYNYATSGAGTPFHVDMEFLMQREQLSMKHIPYKGVAPALQDVVAGRVEMMLIDAGPALPLIKAGRLNAIAVASAKRLAQLPDVPTLNELEVEDRKLYAWQGVIVPAKTPREIIERLSQALNRAVASEKASAALREMVAEPHPSTPEEMAAAWHAEIERSHKLIKERGIKVD